MSEQSHKLLQVEDLKMYFPLRTGRFGTGSTLDGKGRRRCELLSRAR